MGFLFLSYVSFTFLFFFFKNFLLFVYLPTLSFFNFANLLGDNVATRNR